MASKYPELIEHTSGELPSIVASALDLHSAEVLLF
jgi:hypothetical protein